MLELGLARILMPARFGGYELDFKTWHDAVLAISRADASHGWCASLIVHHAHLVAQFPEECQQAVWADAPDVAISASFAPRAQAVRAPGGYRVSGENSSFSSGVDHSTWVMVGAMLPGEGAPEWVFFMIPPGDYTVRDTWFTAGMRGTGSNTIVTDNVFVPETRMLRLTDLRQGRGPGAALYDNPIFRAPFFFYAPLTFAAPMLGAAQGAYAHFREWTKPARQSMARRWREDRGASADGARRGRPRCRRDAAAPHHGGARHAGRGGAALAGALDPRFRAGLGNVGRRHRHVDDAQRHGRLSPTRSRSSAPGATFICLDPCQPAPRSTTGISAAPSSACRAIRTGRSFDKTPPFNHTLASHGKARPCWAAFFT